MSDREKCTCHQCGKEILKNQSMEGLCFNCENNEGKRKLEEEQRRQIRKKFIKQIKKKPAKEQEIVKFLK